MARRKRLDPAAFAGSDPLPPDAPSPDSVPADAPPEGLEHKALFPVAYTPPLRRAAAGAARAPIAEVAREDAVAAAFEEVSQALSAARAEGRLIQRLPLDAVDAGHLVRDRSRLDPAEMAALVASIRARGQQAAIEVVALTGGADGLRWGLVSGWRRLSALRQLHAEAPDDPRFAGVLALVRAPAAAAGAWLAMVEENEIRAGLSFYERARIVARAADHGIYPDDRAALAALFAAAPRARRSKIGSFVGIVRALDGALHFPEALSEKAGLALALALAADPGLAARIRAATAAAPPASAAAEAALLARLLRRPAPRPPAPPESPRPGLTLREARSGALTLSGPALRDPAFRAALFAFLRRG